jgi:flavin-binding protein dodecin
MTGRFASGARRAGPAFRWAESADRETGHAEDDAGVAVQKAIELTGSGSSIEDAVSEALDRAGLTLQGISRFEVERVAGEVDGSRVTYQVELRVWFTLLERVHG